MVSPWKKKKSSNDEDNRRNKDLKDFNYISTTLGSEMAKDSLDERNTTIREGQNEHTFQPLLSFPSVRVSYFLFLFSYFNLHISYPFHFFKLHID